MNITYYEEVNEFGVWIMHFISDEVEIGVMFRTYHPTISFEVYRAEHLRKAGEWNSRRVHSKEEAIKWLNNENI